ncbi:MAG: hypothetical protein QXJ06_05645 [Candidatus Aenigmatarchaeota archaeon]|nr:hypothetical protein [Candidatus Aenigmarchaeota archaeon]
MKGDSFFVKSIYLILIILAIAFFINRFVSINISNVEIEKIDEFENNAKIIYNKLLSEDCLGYKEESNIDNQKLKITSHKIIDKSKLDNFVKKYPETEPLCAIDGYYGYRVEITSPEFYFSTSSNQITKETIIVKKDNEQWIFGQKVFSEEDALERQTELTFPVVIFYSMNKYIPAKMKIIFSSGDLEKLSSFIDRSCNSLGFDHIEIEIHYPVYLLNNGKYICMKFPKGDKCQKLLCDKEIEFNNIEKPGYYSLKSNSQNNKIKIIG